MPCLSPSLSKHNSPGGVAHTLPGRQYESWQIRGILFETSLKILFGPRNQEVSAAGQAHRLLNLATEAVALQILLCPAVDAVECFLDVLD